MGYTLHRELRKALGPDITPLERLVALQIALDARDPDAPPNPSDSRKPRESRIKLDNLAEWTGAKDAKVVRKMLQRLAAAGWEFRVPLGKDKNGNPIYAVPGRVLNFRVPEPPEGGTVIPPKAEGGTTVLPKGGPAFPLGGTDVLPYVLPPTSNEVLPPGSSIASLSPSVPRKPAQAERDQIFIHLAHEHGVSAQRLAQVAREHGATPQEFAGAWRMAEGTAPGADEYERGDGEGSGFRLYLGAWIKADAEVTRDLANYRDKVQYDARQAEYAARGNCEFHWQPYPCLGCAADAKAANDDV